MVEARVYANFKWRGSSAWRIPRCGGITSARRRPCGNECSTTRTNQKGCTARQSLVTAQYMMVRINEFGLWHGTKPEVADILATSGFDERVAELGGLYGAGSYFGDEICKSNQYAVEVNTAGEHCMLYCRVTMGSAYKTAQQHRGLRRPRDNPGTPGAPFDSIFAETGVANGGRQLHNVFATTRSTHNISSGTKSK